MLPGKTDGAGDNGVPPIPLSTLGTALAAGRRGVTGDDGKDGADAPLGRGIAVAVCTGGWP